MGSGNTNTIFMKLIVKVFLSACRNSALRNTRAKFFQPTNSELSIALIGLEPANML